MVRRTFSTSKGRGIACLAAIVIAVGCSSALEEVVEDEAAPASVQVAAPSEAAAPNPAEPTLATTAIAAATPPVDAAKIAAAPPFTPSFPERLDLFAPPKRAVGTVRKDEEIGATVELKGFINVDSQKVVLSIDGVIATLPAGGEKYGVQVLSIDPPSVVLQRGKTRWPAKLE